MSIFVIDKASKNNLGTIDFIPRNQDRIVLNKELTNNELIVACVLYMPKEQGILVFVDMVEPYYSAMVNDIKWNLK